MKIEVSSRGSGCAARIHTSNVAATGDAILLSGVKPSGNGRENGECRPEHVSRDREHCRFRGCLSAVVMRSRIASSQPRRPENPSEARSFISSMYSRVISSEIASAGGPRAACHAAGRPNPLEGIRASFSRICCRRGIPAVAVRQETQPEVSSRRVNALCITAVLVAAGVLALA